jgi:hypothetical protein
MPTTYSISQGVTYAETLPNFAAVLNVLPDNTQKLIAPRDVRDTIFTAWENIVYKKTKTSTSDIEYVGIDRNDLQQKVYFGKKMVGGVEVMTEDLLVNDVDFYFYNNKTEPQENYNTRIAILGGSPNDFFKSGQISVPFLECRVVTTTIGDYLNFEIRNKSYVTDNVDLYGGDINIFSDRGHVSINGIIFSKYLDNIKPENDGKYLRLLWDGNSAYYATWSVVEIPEVPDPIDPANIFFTDSTKVPQTIGGITKDSTFDNVPITEVMRRLLYPYLKPSLSVSWQYSVIESGDTATRDLQRFNYEITKAGTYSIVSRELTPSLLRPDSPALFTPPFDGTSFSSFVKPAFNIALSPTQVISTITHTLKIVDANQTTIEKDASFSIVLPWYYGTSTVASNTATDINNILGSTTPAVNKLTAILKTEASATSVSLTTNNLAGLQGCMYFGYPSTYGDLLSIKDANDFEILDVGSPDFTKYTITGINSPDSRWNNRSYKFYIFTRNTGAPILTKISGVSTFKFSFTK